MKKACMFILMSICGLLCIPSVLLTVMCVIVLEPTFILTSGLLTFILFKLTKKFYRKFKNNEPVKEKVKFEGSLKDRINVKLDEWNEKIDKKIERQTDENGEYHLNEKEEKFAKVGGTILGVLVCIGMVVGGIALIVLLFNVLGAVIAFLFDILFYVLGFIAAIFIIGGFLSFWWDLVKWEHVYKPRGYVRVKRRRRR